MQDENFIFHESKKSCKNLILFIHGFTGNAEKTWVNKNGNSFASLLLAPIKPGNTSYLFIIMFKLIQSIACIGLNSCKLTENIVEL